MDQTNKPPKYPHDTTTRRVATLLRQQKKKKKNKILKLTSKSHVPLIARYEI